MKIKVQTLILIVFIFQIGITYVEPYNFKCPTQGNWKFRANAKCNNTLKYFCLFNIAERKYVEGCKEPDWDRKGSKRIFSGSFTRGNCSKNRYQPFIFKTNESMTDCVFAKSICREEGQIIYQGDSPKKDRTCRCDYAKNYAFIKIPRNFCYCIPSEEDCSCYMRSCPVNYILSTDYECIPSGIQQNIKCIDNNIHYETVGEKPRVKMKQGFLFHTRLKLKERSETGATVVLCLCLILLIGGISYVLLHLYGRVFGQSASEMHQLEENIQGRKTDSLPIDDVNFLRIIHLLFRMALPVLKMKLNNEIKPYQLRKTLDDKRSEMETLYRENETIINDNQWDLLYNPVKGGTVKSEEFDIRLTIYLLCTLAKYKVESEYPDPSDLSDSAMLSRIKCIRNKASRRFESEISEDKLKQYWNDIRQAVQRLVCEIDIENDIETRQKIENLKEKSRLIPEGRHLYNIDYDSTNLTTEENNFLIVFYVLAKIVYPVIKNEFNIKCTDWKFKETAGESCQTQVWKDNHSIKMQYINPTKENQQQYSGKKEELRNLDLRWMIFILNIQAIETGNKDSSDQLEVINEIQREIVQSSSGMLNEEMLNDILDRTKKAVLHLGGEWNEEQVLRLQQTNIF